MSSRALCLAHQVDQQGVRIVVSARAAYDLWLTNNIRRAEIVRTESPGLERSLSIFEEGQCMRLHK